MDELYSLIKNYITNRGITMYMNEDGIHLYKMNRYVNITGKRVHISVAQHITELPIAVEKDTVDTIFMQVARIFDERSGH